MKYNLMSQYAQIIISKVSDLGLASTLLTMGYEIVSMEEETDAKNRPRKVFNFRDSEELQDNIQKYWNGELRLEPQKLITALRKLKSRIHYG